MVFPYTEIRALLTIPDSRGGCCGSWPAKIPPGAADGVYFHNYAGNAGYHLEEFERTGATCELSEQL
ncbi:MAG: hypothetical protein ACLR0U_00280 [Enterocloster clostridioformis]